LKHTEIQLGYALFNRTSTGMVPTERAQRLFPQIERLFIDLNAARDHAMRLRAATKASLRVHVVPALSHASIPQAIALFLAKHPDCDLHISTNHSAAILNAVALSEADLGITFAVKAHPNVSAQALTQIPLVCVAKKGLFKQKQTVSLAALAKMQMVHLDVRDPIGQVLNRVCEAAGVQLKGPVTAQTNHCALALAQIGAGVTIIDAISAVDANLQLVDVLLLEPPVLIDIHVLRPIRAATAGGLTPADLFYDCLMSVMAPAVKLPN
jgi:DNA-binding transcriptional LysR family regulator